MNEFDAGPEARPTRVVRDDRVRIFFIRQADVVVAPGGITFTFRQQFLTVEGYLGFAFEEGIVMQGRGGEQSNLYMSVYVEGYLDRGLGSEPYYTYLQTCLLVCRKSVLEKEGLSNHYP